ncbi:unnamed protein product [Caretta caretta]
MEPPVLHDNMLSWDGALLASESSLGTDGSQKQAPREEHEVTRFMKLIPERTVNQKQRQILSPYSEELFDQPPPPEKQPTAKTAANMVETEATSEADWCMTTIYSLLLQ